MVKNWNLMSHQGLTHYILKLDWASSNKLTFEATLDKALHFKCASNVQGERIWLAGFYALFLFKRWIKLDQID